MLLTIAEVRGRRGPDRARTIANRAPEVNDRKRIRRRISPHRARSFMFHYGAFSCMNCWFGKRSGQTIGNMPETFRNRSEYRKPEPFDNAKRGCTLGAVQGLPIRSWQ